MTEPILLDKKKVAALLSISVRSVDNLISRGDLRVRRIGRRCLLERRIVEQFCRRDHKTQPDGKGSRDGQ